MAVLIWKEIMGSFNVTCGITGIPIEYGEDIVAIPLVAQRKDEEESFPPFGSDLGWAALPFYIQGKYGDYGYVDLNGSYEIIHLDVAGEYEFDLGDWQERRQAKSMSASDKKKATGRKRRSMSKHRGKSPTYAKTS
jgi:hypothetical protein